MTMGHRCIFVVVWKPLSTVSTVDNHRMKSYKHSLLACELLWCWNVLHNFVDRNSFVCILLCWKCSQPDLVTTFRSLPDLESLAADQGMMCWSSLWRVQLRVKTIRINGASRLSKGEQPSSVITIENTIDSGSHGTHTHTFLGLPWGKFPCMYWHWCVFIAVCLFYVQLFWCQHHIVSQQLQQFKSPELPFALKPVHRQVGWAPVPPSSYAWIWSEHCRRARGISREMQCSKSLIFDGVHKTRIMQQIKQYQIRNSKKQ